MPVHRVPVADGDLERAVANLERTSRIVAATPAGDGAILVFTESKAAARKAGGRETR